MIDLVECPALVGRKEAAEMLAVYPENIFRVPGLPRPLQDRRIRGFKVTTGAIWPRAEIEALVKVEAARRKREGRESMTAARKALAAAKTKSPREQSRRAKSPRRAARA